MGEGVIMEDEPDTVDEPTIATVDIELETLDQEVTEPVRPQGRVVKGEGDMGQESRIKQLRDELEPYVADRDSEKGRKVIEEGREDQEPLHHVYEIWEDGEVTSTKGSDLFRKRTLHRIHFPFLEDDLWEVPEDDVHVSKVVVDKEALNILEEHRKEVWEQREEAQEDN